MLQRMFSKSKEITSSNVDSILRPTKVLSSETVALIQTKSPTMSPAPQKPRLSPLLTDLYELTMAYSYYNHGRHREAAVFDVFFRSAPFNGTFTIFAGLSDVLHFIQNFEFTQEEVDYLCKENNLNIAPDSEFRKYLLEDIKEDLKELKIYAIPEGSVVFPRIPVIRLEGSLGLCQILETPILNLTGYASLVTTNAARMKLAAGDRVLLEFGLRRAQGPDGGISAAKYAVMGGFLGTSNCLAGQLYEITISGTLAHSFVSSFEDYDKPLNFKLKLNNSETVKDLSKICGIIKNIYSDNKLYVDANQSELIAFVSYATTFPKNFLALVDTYNTLKSGVPNFLIVSLGLMLFGYAPKGIRLDSGDLKELSTKTREMFNDFKTNLIAVLESSLVQEYCDWLDFESEIEKFQTIISSFLIVASNDLDEAAIKTLVGNDKSSKNRPKKFPKNQKCEINSFGIGTHLVTCKAQPALGMVYKLVEIGKKSCIKFSEDREKQTYPGAKEGFRLYDRDHVALCDVMASVFEPFWKQLDLDVIKESGAKTTLRRLDGRPVEIVFYSFVALHQPHNLTDAKKIMDLKKVVEQSMKTKNDQRKADLKPGEVMRVFEEEVFSESNSGYEVYLTEELFEKTEKLKEKYHKQ